MESSMGHKVSSSNLLTPNEFHRFYYRIIQAFSLFLHGLKKHSEVIIPSAEPLKEPVYITAASDNMAICK